MAQGCHDCQVKTGQKNSHPPQSKSQKNLDTQSDWADARTVGTPSSESTVSTPATQSERCLETLGLTKTLIDEKSEQKVPTESKTLKGRSSYRIHRALRATGLLPSKNAYICLKAGISADRVTLIKTHKGHVSKKGLVSCGLLWQCSVCRQRLLREKRELLKTVTQRSATNNVMVTLTMPHKKGDDLAHMMTTLRDGWNRFRNDRQWKHLQKRLGFKWGVSTTEVTYGKNGFHPHLHVLLGYLEDPSGVIQDIKNLIQAIWTRVCDAFRKDGVIATSIKHAISVTLMALGLEEYLVKWTCADEVVDSSQIKKGKNGNQSIAELEMIATEQYEVNGSIEPELYFTLKEYYKKMTGKKFFQPIGEFKKYSQYNTDEIDENPEDEPILDEESEDGAETVHGETTDGTENNGTVHLKPWIWNGFIHKYGIAQKLIIEMENRDNVYWVYQWLQIEFENLLPDMDEITIEFIIYDNVEIYDPILDAGFMGKS